MSIGSGEGQTCSRLGGKAQKPSFYSLPAFSTYLRTMCMYSGPVKHSRALSSPEASSYMPVGPSRYRSSRASSLCTL